MTRRRFLHHALCLTGLPLLVTSARADEETYADHFIIYRPWTPEAASAGADVPVYLEFLEITADDQLLGASSQAAEAVELVTAEGEAMPALPLRAATGTLALGPEGPHLVMRGLRMDFEGLHVYPLELRFARAGTIFTHIEIGEE